MKRPFLVLVSLVVCVLSLVFADVLRAQVDRGSVAGTVTDSSGAIVPGAAITLTNVATDQSTKLTTDASGNYVANLLHIGTYRLTGEKQGFQRTVQENIEIGVNQVVRVDLILRVGAVTQTVDVSAAPPLIQTETSSLGSVLNTGQIVQLPLNERNFIGLAYLTPGANSGMTGSNASGGVFENERGNEALSVNGLRVSNNNYLLDGVDNNEWGLGGIIALPPPDAIQEFRIEENSMSAEFGRGGAAVNVALKSGSNEVHGGVYEFLRNDKLDARNFFDADRAPFRRNQFGGFLGGPIKRDKAFLFGDYQGFRRRQGLTSISTVPNALERTGDFSDRLTGASFSPCPAAGPADPVFDAGAIFDPLTTRNFTCNDGTVVPLRSQFAFQGRPNVIDPARINTVGLNVANLYPSSNRPGAGLADNFLLNPKLSNDQDAFDVRFDERVSEHDQLFAHMSYSNIRSLHPGPLGDLGGETCCPSNSKNRAQHWAAGWTHTFGPSLLSDLHGGYFRYVVQGLPLNFGKNLSQTLGIPNANRGDPTSSGLTVVEPSGFTGLGDSLWTPEFVVENIFQIADTLSTVRGKHSLKFGIDFRRQQRNFFQTTAPAGWYTFSGDYTLDLGTSSGGNGLADLLLGVPISSYQDTLQGEYPTRYWDLAGFVQDDFRVTPNLTLNLGLRYEVLSPANGRIGNFDLEKAVVANAEGPNGVPHAGIAFDKNNFGPRVGLAWSPFGGKRTVVRSGFGVFYSTEGNIFDDLGLSPPYLSVNSQVFNKTNLPQPGQLISEGFPATVSFPDPAHPFGTVRTNGPEHVIPYIMEWNFNIQREFGHNWVLQTAYVGTRAVRLWNHESSDLNQPLLPLDSNFSVGNLGRPYYGRLPDLDVILPLDFPQLGMIYHSFQASMTKRLSSGLSLLTSYTFAKNLGTADGNVGSQIQNSHDIAAEKGAVQPDFRHRFTAGYVYELPFGQHRRFLGNLGRASDLALGGWQLSGITVIRSGEAFTPFLSFDPTNTGTGGRPDRIHDPNDFSFNVPGQQALGCPGGKQTLDCWYNQAAFVVPPLAPGQTFATLFGNGGRSTLRGPDQVNFDLALMKDFRITERNRLQFRAELFNMLNHPQFGLPDGTVDVEGGSAVTSTLPDNQREIQLALKWTF